MTCISRKNFLRNSTSLLDFKLLTSAAHEPNRGIEH